MVIGRKCNSGQEKIKIKVKVSSSLNIRLRGIAQQIGIQEEGKFLFPFIGEGNVDWKGMFDALREIGYAGYCSVEFESYTYHNHVLKGDTVEAARRTISDVRAVMAL